ncbi:MAG: YceI family protein [Thermoanaerobaculia bacterium]|nr:YceI family protein [Thermoanaerobaculia bacterium]
MKSKLAILSTLIVLLCSSVTEGRAAMYEVDPRKSSLILRVFKAGIAKGLAHDHVIRATEISGSVDLDPKRPSEGSIVVSVDATSLEADETALRSRFDLKPMEDDSRREIQQTMEGEGQLHVDRYPEIRFESTRIETMDDGEYRVVGRFTLHGTTRTVELVARTRIDREKGTLRGETSFRFLQSDYGIEPYQAAFGAVKNRDEVELRVTLVATRSSAARGSSESEELALGNRSRR